MLSLFIVQSIVSRSKIHIFAPSIVYICIKIIPTCIAESHKVTINRKKLLNNARIRTSISSDFLETARPCHRRKSSFGTACMGGWSTLRAGLQARPVVAKLRSIAKRGSPRRELSVACNAVGIKGEPSWCMEMQDRCARSRSLFHVGRRSIVRNR